MTNIDPALLTPAMECGPDDSAPLLVLADWCRDRGDYDFADSLVWMVCSGRRPYQRRASISNDVAFGWRWFVGEGWRSTDAVLTAVMWQACEFAADLPRDTYPWTWGAGRTGSWVEAVRWAAGGLAMFKARAAWRLRTSETRLTDGSATPGDNGESGNIPGNYDEVIPAISEYLKTCENHPIVS